MQPYWSLISYASASRLTPSFISHRLAISLSWHSSRRRHCPYRTCPQPGRPRHSLTTTSTASPSLLRCHRTNLRGSTEFIEFSTLCRGAHRRSASDSIAFLETAGMLRDQDNDGVGGIDGLDDEQLMSMFSGDCSAAAPPTLLASSPSTPNSDQNSNKEDKAAPPQLPKTEAAEVDSESEAPPSDRTVTDPKRVKRILANRQSAHRSRVRKLQYISELEHSFSTLQTEVSVLSPRVAFLDHQRLILNVDNSALMQRIAALAQDKIFKDAHQEALKKEIQKLRKVYEHQRQPESGGDTNNSNGAEMKN